MQAYQLRLVTAQIIMPSAIYLHVLFCLFIFIETLSRLASFASFIYTYDTRLLVLNSFHSNS